VDREVALLALATRRAGLVLLNVEDSNKGRVEMRARSMVGEAAFFFTDFAGVEMEENERLVRLLALEVKAPTLAPAAPLFTDETNNALPPMRIRFGLAAEEVTVFF